MEVLGGNISIDVLTDDNLADILVHLDAVSVLRCRAVCKSWRRIATDRSFLAAHAAARPREMIIEIETNGYVYARSTVPLSPTDADLDTMTAGGGDDGDGRRHHRYLFDTRATPADGDGISSAFTLFASLDGLLLLKQWRRSGAPITSDYDTFTYVVCNPVTRRWAILPSPVPRRRHACDFRAAVACGFYLHASSGDGEYRLLVHCVVRDWPGDLHSWEHYYCVLSVGSALPRRLPHAPPTDRLVPHYDDPVSYHGTLHWLSGHPQGRTTGKMLAFDTVSETFRLMPRPPEGPAPAPTEATSDLLVLDGELSVATIYKNGNDTMLDVWALQDYEAEKWTLRHRLNVQRPPRSASNIMAMGNAPHGSSSVILIGCPRTREVMVYSLKDNKVRKEIDFGGFATCFRVFSESLVPHAFLDSPDTVPLNKIFKSFVQ